jgi:hypothetical protein
MTLPRPLGCAPRSVEVGLAIACIATIQAACSAPRAIDAPVAPAPPTATRPAPADFMDGYYLARCAACPALLGVKGEAIDATHEGRPLRFCCAACKRRFDADPSAVIREVDAAMLSDQLPHYPLNASLMDGRPLGPAPIDFVWGNRAFRARDGRDRDRIMADPIAAIRSLDKAVIAAQEPTYAMHNKCPVQGDILPDDPVIDIVVANRMIRVCCGRCARVVKARPYQYIGMVDFANREAAQQADRSASEAR